MERSCPGCPPPDLHRVLAGGAEPWASGPQREGWRFPRGSQQAQGPPAREPGCPPHTFHLWVADLDSWGQPWPCVRGKAEVPQQWPSQNLLEQQGVTGESEPAEGPGPELRAGKGPWGPGEHGGRPRVCIETRGKSKQPSGSSFTARSGAWGADGNWGVQELPMGSHNPSEQVGQAQDIRKA